MIILPTPIITIRVIVDDKDNDNSDMGKNDDGIYHSNDGNDNKESDSNKDSDNIMIAITPR